MNEAQLDSRRELGAIHSRNDIVPALDLTLHRTMDGLRPDFIGIHVWLLDMDDVATGKELDAGVLSPAEHSRAARLRSLEHRRRFTAAHVALRHLLGQATGTDPARLMFCRTSFGKPVLAAGQGGAVRFNLSHAENILAVAIARAEIGVDVEIIRPEIDLATLVADHLAPAERRLLEELPDEERPREFFRLWTQKEAAAKAAGRCLRCSPLGGAGRPSAACDACRLRQQVTPARPEDWRVRTFDARVGDVDVAASVVSAKFDIHPKQ